MASFSKYHLVTWIFGPYISISSLSSSVSTFSSSCFTSSYCSAGLGRLFLPIWMTYVFILSRTLAYKCEFGFVWIISCNVCAARSLFSIMSKSDEVSLLWSLRVRYSPQRSESSNSSPKNFSSAPPISIRSLIRLVRKSLSSLRFCSSYVKSCLFSIRF